MSQVIFQKDNDTFVYVEEVFDLVKGQGLTYTGVGQLNVTNSHSITIAILFTGDVFFIPETDTYTLRIASKCAGGYVTLYEQGEITTTTPAPTTTPVPTTTPAPTTTTSTTTSTTTTEQPVYNVNITSPIEKNCEGKDSILVTDPCVLNELNDIKTLVESLTQKDCGVTTTQLVHSKSVKTPVDYDVVVQGNGFNDVQLSIINHETREPTLIEGSRKLGGAPQVGQQVGIGYDAVWFSVTDNCYYVVYNKLEYDLTSPYDIKLALREVYKYNPTTGEFSLSEDRTTQLFEQFNIDYANGGGANLISNPLPPAPATITEIDGTLYVFEGTNGSIVSYDQFGNQNLVQTYSNIVDTSTQQPLGITTIIGIYWLGNQAVVSYLAPAGEFLGIVDDVPTFSKITPTGIINGNVESVDANSMVAPFSDTELYVYRGISSLSGEVAPFVYDITTGELTKVDGDQITGTDGTDRIGYTVSCQSFYQYVCGGVKTYYDLLWNEVEVDESTIEPQGCPDCSCDDNTVPPVDYEIKDSKIIYCDQSITEQYAVRTYSPNLSGGDSILLRFFVVQYNPIQVILNIPMSPFVIWDSNAGEFLSESTIRQQMISELTQPLADGGFQLNDIIVTTTPTNIEFYFVFKGFEDVDRDYSVTLQLQQNNVTNAVGSPIQYTFEKINCSEGIKTERYEDGVLVNTEYYDIAGNAIDTNFTPLATRERTLTYHKVLTENQTFVESDIEFVSIACSSGSCTFSLNGQPDSKLLSGESIELQSADSISISSQGQTSIIYSRKVGV